MSRRKPKPPAKPARHRARWDPAEDDRLRELHAQEVTIRESAAVLQRTVGTVGFRKHKLGLTYGRDHCERCGAKVAQPTKGRRRKFCEFECAWRSSHEHQAVQQEVARVARCEDCGGDLSGRRRKYCSSECRQRGWYKRQPHYAGLWTSSSNDVSDLPRGTGRGQPPASVRPSHGRQRAA